MSNTFDDYIIAVKSKYEVEKDKIYSDFLLKPSPAQLREFCLLIFDGGLSNKDKEVFELFFKAKPNTTLRNAIENFDVEKFRKICNFLNGRSATTSQNSLNLIAILVNYELRPFSYFLKSEFKTENIEVKKINKVEEESNIIVEVVNNFSKENIKGNLKSKVKMKVVIGVFGLIGLSSIGYTLKKIVVPDSQCMQWQKNHYEVIDCQSNNQQGFVKQSEVIPFDENKGKLIKIEVSDTTTFFKNGKSLYWYCKVNGKPEFFNTQGLHPETNIALKPVTEYIVEKYVK